ncbi:MAG TPA: RDD family protein [Stellaceae bacterium]|nr:RDD family protein [Stellaceae bacterium]
MSVTDERVADFLEGPQRRNRREIVSPEGVPLAVEIATYGERATAFMLDFLFFMLATFFLVLVGAAIAVSLSGGSFYVAMAVVLLVALLVRVFYFINFELIWQGATPGKRIVGLRVIDRRGGPLRSSQVIARNLTRELEMFMPLGMLLSFSGGKTAAWEQLALGLWALLFTCLPFVNRDRMRGGDLIAGTIVVSAPRRALLGDLVDATLRHVFTEKQLRAYGAFELQILEELLRRPLSRDTGRIWSEVADKIISKIAWPSPVAARDVERFLRDFYTAERAFLEREQLFGKPRADKHAEEKAVS